MVISSPLFLLFLLVQLSAVYLLIYLSQAMHTQTVVVSFFDISSGRFAQFHRCALASSNVIVHTHKGGATFWATLIFHNIISLFSQ